MPGRGLTRMLAYRKCICIDPHSPAVSSYCEAAATLLGAFPFAMVITLNMSTDTKEVEAVEAPCAERRSGMFRALSHRNYRLFWSGAFVSNTGTWMQAVAQGWLVFQLSNSPFWLGLDAFMGMAPGIVLTLAGGVFADLVDRRRLLIYTQVVSGLSALALGILVATD